MKEDKLKKKAISHVNKMTISKMSEYMCEFKIVHFSQEPEEKTRQRVKDSLGDTGYKTFLEWVQLNDRPNSDEKYDETIIKKICEETGLNYGSVPERVQAMIRLDNGYKINSELPKWLKESEKEVDKIRNDHNSEEPSNEELIEDSKYTIHYWYTLDAEDKIALMTNIEARLASLNEENQLLTAKIEKGRGLMKKIEAASIIHPDDDKEDMESQLLYISLRVKEDLAELEK